MDILKRRFKGIKREFKIYSKEEADNLGIRYLPWGSCRVGDWGISDDGYVGECLDINGPYKSNSIARHCFVFSFGRAWEGGKLTYLDRTSYYNTSGKPWIYTEMRTRRCKNLIKTYVMMFLAGKVDWDKLGRVYRPDQINPARTAKYIFKQEEVKKMIDDKLQKEFSDRGITEGDVIDRYLTIYQKADKKKNPDLRVMKSVNDEFRDMLDMKPKPEAKGYLYPGDEVEADYEAIEERIDKAELAAKQRQIAAK